MSVDLSSKIADRDGNPIWMPGTEPLPASERDRVTSERYAAIPVAMTAAAAITFALDRNPHSDKPLSHREAFERVALADRICNSPHAVTMTTAEAETCKTAVAAVFSPLVAARIGSLFAVASANDRAAGV